MYGVLFLTLQRGGGALQPPQRWPSRSPPINITPKITPRWLQVVFRVLCLLIYPCISKSPFINGRGDVDFINGGGLLTRGGDYDIYIYIYTHICLHTICMLCKHAYVDILTAVFWDPGVGGCKSFARNHACFHNSARGQLDPVHIVGKGRGSLNMCTQNRSTVLGRRALFPHAIRLPRCVRCVLLLRRRAEVSQLAHWVSSGGYILFHIT